MNALLFLCKRCFNCTVKKATFLGGIRENDDNGTSIDFPESCVLLAGIKYSNFFSIKYL